MAGKRALRNRSPTIHEITLSLTKEHEISVYVQSASDVKAKGRSPFQEAALFHLNLGFKDYGWVRARFALMASSRARGTTSTALATCGSSFISTCKAVTLP